MNTKIATILLLASASTLAACGKKAPEQLPPPPAATTTTPAAPAQPAGPQVGSQEHFRNAVNGQTVVYFDLDRYNISSQSAATLQAQAQYFAQNRQVNFTIEGHADERGTREYNLALGERRANAAKNYLVSLGIDAGRISVVSYGKERPVALGSNEEAWAQNRRAATVIIR
ncbi:MAG: peptidoglycan-associated lipoprotein Pal [Erythrobacter sp.]